MSVAYERSVDRIQTLQRAYSAQQSDLPGLEERIGLLRDVVALALTGTLDVGPATLAEHQHQLGAALYERFMHLRDRSDLEQAETHLRLALPDFPAGSACPGPHSVLGSVLREHGRATEDSDMAEQAVAIHRRLCVPDETTPTRAKAHCARELGLSLCAWRSVSGQSDEVLLESITHLRRAQQMYTEVGPPDHMCALGLCSAFSSLYSTRTRQTDLDDSISYGALAVATSGPGHRDFYRVISVSCWARLTRVEYHSDTAGTLEDIVDSLRGALAGAPPRWRCHLADSLGFALNLRFTQQGREEDLAETIACTEAALTEGALDASDYQWSRLQQRLSRVLFYRFERTGAPEDIEGAASAAAAASSRASGASQGNLMRLGLLAMCRAAQYQAFGDLAHLNECIASFEQITQAAQPQSLVRKYAVGNLLEVLQLRYLATGHASDLDRAVGLVAVVLANTDKGDVLTPMDLQNAGNAFLLHFEATGALEDLDQATACLRQAAENCASRTRESHERVETYAKVLRIRYETLHEDASAAHALRLYKQVAASLPNTHPDRPRALCGLARLQLCMNSRHRDVAEALTALRDALQSQYCPAYRRLKDVSEVLAYVSTHMKSLAHEDVLQVCGVYSTAISLLPQVASFGLEPRARLSVVSGAGVLTTQGAIHAISVGELNLALEMLEAGRTVFWTQGLQLRTSFAELPGSMGGQLTKITYALARPISDELDEPGRERELARRRQLGDEFRSVLDEARLIPGFAGLLLNTTFTSIAQAAAHHPIVALVADETSGYAIIVQGEARCRLVVLPSATTKALQGLSHRLEKHSKQVRSSRGMRKVNVGHGQSADVYQEIWTWIMCPVVEALQLPKSKGRERPRLTLCPTGVFMQLPLHAAGVYSGDKQVSCSDYFVSSYTPSITALLRAQQSAKRVRRCEADTLLVAVDKPLQGTPLPMTSQEAVTVQRLVSPLAKVIRISKCDEVLEHIRTASILHLACHGTQSLADALQSSFHLEDGTLPVSKLMELELPSAFLAVLSACETAKGDSTQPDQAIHLAATMVFAGFKSVVATMWFMGDAEGPEIADVIYLSLFPKSTTSEYLDPSVVPYALDDAVQKLRRSGLEPSFWATYVHIGI